MRPLKVHSPGVGDVSTYVTSVLFCLVLITTVVLTTGAVKVLAARTGSPNSSSSRGETPDNFESEEEFTIHVGPRDPKRARILEDDEAEVPQAAQGTQGNSCRLCRSEHDSAAHNTVGRVVIVGGVAGPVTRRQRIRRYEEVDIKNGEEAPPQRPDGSGRYSRGILQGMLLALSSGATRCVYRIFKCRGLRC